MNQLQIFSNPEFGQVRMIEVDGEPYFVGKDVADILGYQNGSRDINRHVDEEDRQNYQNGTFESPRGVTIINESGLYSLILSSKLPTAKKFKRWVTSEILPSIRKTGSYSVNDQLPYDPNYILGLAELLSKTPKSSFPYVVKAIELQHPGIFDGIEQPKTKPCNNQTDSSTVRTTLLKFLDDNNVLGIPTNQVYADYLDFCKTQHLNPTNKYNFSKQVVKILNIKIDAKKINGKKYRMFISK